jgi:hypothetical protein
MHRLILFTFLFLACCYAKAQKNIASDSFFKTYAINKIQNGISTIRPSTTIYLVKLPDKFKTGQHSGFKIIRRLSADHYIIQTEISPEKLGIVNFSQANNMWKASDNLVKKWEESSAEILHIQLVLKSTDETYNRLQLSSKINVLSSKGKLAFADINKKDLTELLDNPNIEFADLVRKPVGELLINNLDLSVNEITAVHRLYPAISGNGINVSLKEDRYDKNDLDLLGRSFTSSPSSPNQSAHASTMATLIGGNGNSYIYGLGVAPKVRFTSSDYAQLFPDDSSVFYNNNISIQNHSYGTGIENYYGAEANEYDRQSYMNDSLVHVFSAGNSRTSTPNAGVYAGLVNRANLTGTFKQAKNVLVVGGTNRESTTEALSSKGPAYDGRIKPELVSAGEDGTSGAAAITTGLIGLLQQQYKDQTGSLPSSALLKSILINSADDIGNPHVDFENGYGKLNALEAVRTIRERRYQNGTISALQDYSFPVQILPSTSLFKVSLAWNDPAATINSAQALVNDLDIWLEDPSGNKILPWVLNSYPKRDSLSKVAVRKRDSLNNTEQVTVENPVPGNYIIRIEANQILQGSQGFHFSYQAEASNSFEWTYPQLNDQLFSGKDNYIRWKNTFKGTSGSLSVSYDAGVNWTAIGSTNGSSSFFKWTIPSSFSKALLKMTINGTDYISPSFSISKPLALKVGFNCSDGILLIWPKQQGAVNYNVYTIKDDILQLLQSTADTMLQISGNGVSSDYYAVSATSGQGFEGLRSFTININSQGVGCYVQTFLANPGTDENIILNLNIGTTTGLKSIKWEKLAGPDQFTAMGATEIIGNTLSYSFNDGAPKTGLQFYRALLETESGKLIYSDTISAVYLNPYQFTLFPNPANESFSVLAGTIDDFEINLYNSAGQKMSTAILNNLTQSYSVAKLKAGIYLCIITLKGKPVYKGKLIKT